MYTIFETENPRTWNCTVLALAGTLKKNKNAFLGSELSRKTQKRGQPKLAVNNNKYIPNLSNLSDLGRLKLAAQKIMTSKLVVLCFASAGTVYAFGIHNTRSWKVSYCQKWNARRWNCMLFLELKTPGLESVHYCQDCKLKASFSLSVLDLAVRYFSKF